ncbi:MAG: hypothetical protein NVSMB55_08880 [Mycobacteriales bacterium]
MPPLMTVEQTTAAGRMADALVLLAVGTLPLTATLTLNLKFPLKVYEPSFVIAAFLHVFSSRRHEVRRQLPPPFVALAAFVVAVTISLFYAVRFQAGRPLDSHVYRYGAIADGVLQLFYLLVAIISMGMVWELATRRREDVMKYWLRGALAASTYALYLNAGDLTRKALPELPGTSTQLGYLGGFAFHRAGTFLEGNFFAVYLYSSLGLALLANRPRAGLVISAALVFTLSPLSIAEGLLLWAVFYGVKIRRDGRASPALLALWPLIVMLLVGPAAQFGGLVTEKVRDPSSQSAVERTGTAVAAVNMFRDHPATGVGLNQYSLWFPLYRPQSVPSYFLTGDLRFIPNNVYAQVAAETGVLGLAPFGAFLLIVLRRARQSRNTVLLVTVLGALVSLNAFPSVTVVFLWGFFGIVLASPAQAVAGAPEQVSKAPPARVRRSW